MSLFRLKQLAAIVEATPGTFNSAVYAAAYAQHLLRSDASIDFDIPLYVVDELRGTLTPVEGIPGRKLARANFSLNMRPPSSGSTPSWDVFMRACGMASKPLVKVTGSGALTITGGPLRHGETVSQPAAGTTVGISGKVAMDTYTGAAELWLYDVTVTNLGYSGADPVVGETVTGGTSGATGIVTAVTGASNVATIKLLGTGIYASGEALTGSTTGSLGTASTASIHATDDITGATTAAAVTTGTLITNATAGVHGRAWFPLTYTTFELVTADAGSGAPVVGDVVTGVTSGTVGIVDSVLLGPTPTKYTLTIRSDFPGMYSAGESLTFTGSGVTSHEVGTCVQLDRPTISLAGYNDGVRASCRGMRGTFSIDARTGEAVTLNFNLTGSYQAHGDASNLSGVTYPLRQPPVFLSAGATLGTETNPTTVPSYAPRFSSVSLNLGHDVQYRESANSSSGVLEALIVGRAGTGTIDPELDLEASYPALDNFTNGYAANLRFNVGTAAPSKFIVSVAGMTFNAMPIADRLGQAVRNMAFNINGGHYENASDTPGENNDIVLVYAVV